jgi:hypothetical protein
MKILSAITLFALFFCAKAQDNDQWSDNWDEQPAVVSINMAPQDVPSTGLRGSKPINGVSSQLSSLAGEGYAKSASQTRSVLITIKDSNQLGFEKHSVTLLEYDTGRSMKLGGSVSKSGLFATRRDDLFRGKYEIAFAGEIPRSSRDAVGKVEIEIWDITRCKDMDDIELLKQNGKKVLGYNLALPASFLNRPSTYGFALS